MANYSSKKWCSEGSGSSNVLNPSRICFVRTAKKIRHRPSGSIGCSDAANTTVPYILSNTTSRKARENWWLIRPKTASRGAHEKIVISYYSKWRRAERAKMSISYHLKRRHAERAKMSISYSLKQPLDARAHTDFETRPKFNVNTRYWRNFRPPPPWGTI